MGISTILTVSENGKVTLPEDIQASMNLHVGDRLRAIVQSPEVLTLQLDRSDSAAAKQSAGNWRELEGIHAYPQAQISLPDDLDSNPMSLRGFLRDADVDPNAQRAAERAWELAREEWLYGPYPRR